MSVEKPKVETSTEALPFAKLAVSGSFIKERYIKCPHTDKQCKWRLGKEHRKGYEYLNNSCYLSGSFNLECP